MYRKKLFRMMTLTTYFNVIKIDLKYVCGWNYYTMRLIGIWPGERKWYRPFSYLVLVPVLMMFLFVSAPQTANIQNVYKDMYMLVENLSMGNITISISMLKTIAFWLNGKPLKSLLKCMARDWSNNTKPSNREVMMNIAKITRILIVTSTVGVLVMVFAYVVKYFLTVKHTGRILFFQAYFPYNVDISPNVQLTAFAQFMATMFSATSYTAVDTFIVMLILHICGQLAILRQDVLNLREIESEKLTITLGKIIRRHEYINKFAATIEGCFNMMLLFQMLGCTLQLCFQCYQGILTIDVEDKRLVHVQLLFLSLYVLYIMAQLYLYCYVGDKLTVESTEVANAAYNSAWYNLSSNNAKLLIIIMCRDKLPLRITAGRFCSFTLQLYSEILKRSMGYISVLYTMQH